MTYILKTQQIWLLELLKFQRILLYTVLFAFPIVLTATLPHFDHSRKACNIMTVIESLINNQKRRKFCNLFIQCKTYPNSWKVSWILGYRPCFYTACILFTFKCHNRDMLSPRIVICQNSHNRSGLIKCKIIWHTSHANDTSAQVVTHCRRSAFLISPNFLFAFSLQPCS